MKTGRLIGRMFLTLSLILIGHEVLNALESGEYRLIALGELWFRIDKAMGTGSLNISQAIVQRYISPWLGRMFSRTCSPRLAGWCLAFPGLLWRGPAVIAGGHRELAVKSFETEVAQFGKLIVQSS